jgi:hypothetical protein
MKKRIRTLLFFIMALCYFTKVSAVQITLIPQMNGMKFYTGSYSCDYSPIIGCQVEGGPIYRSYGVFDYSSIPDGSTQINAVLTFSASTPYVCNSSNPINLVLYDTPNMNITCNQSQWNTSVAQNFGPVTFNWYENVSKNFDFGSRLPKYVWVKCYNESPSNYFGYYNLKMVVTYTPPAPIVPAPTGLTLKSYSCNTLNVGWNAVTGATSYAVYLNGVKQTTVSTNSATLSGLNTGTSYNITVTATTSAGTSSQSAVLAATPKLPTILTFNTDLSASSKLGVASQEVDLDPGFDFVATAANTFEAYTSTTCPASKLAVVGEADLTEEVDNSQSDNASKAPEVTNSCFPNPTHGEFTVRMNLPEHQTSEIRVYDSMGKLVKTVVASSTETLVSIEDQPAGIYFVRYTVDGKDQSAKIVKL